MKNYILILAFLSASQAFAAAGEIYLINQAKLGFESMLRVKVAAQVVEADDEKLVGADAPFVQTLLYGASKELQLNKQFNSVAAVADFAQSNLCREKHAVQLSPFREKGAKGVSTYSAELKANTVAVTGIQFVGNKANPYSHLIFCKQAR